MSDDPLTRLSTYLAECLAKSEKATPADQLQLMRYHHGGGRLWVPEPRRDLIADFFDEPNREFYFAARTDLPRVVRIAQALVHFIEDRHRPWPAVATGREMKRFDALGALIEKELGT